VLKATSCAITLDQVARTLTFDHRGRLRSKEQKKSPIVVPFDEIIAVESDFGVLTGWFRIRRRGHEPWKDGIATDPHGANCPCDPTEFAERVRAAVGLPLQTGTGGPVRSDQSGVGGAQPDEPGAGGKTIKKTLGGLFDIVTRF